MKYLIPILVTVGAIVTDGLALVFFDYYTAGQFTFYYFAAVGIGYGFHRLAKRWVDNSNKK